MREPPKISDAAIETALHIDYGVQMASLSFLPLGDDSASSAFRVEAADGACWYLKVRAPSGFSPASLAVPRYLHDRGIPHITPPLRTTTGGLWVLAQGFALSLYPFIEGRMGAHGGLTSQHWQELGALIQQVHSAHLPAQVLDTVPRESFVPSRRGLIERLEAAVNREDLTGAQRELARFWRSQRDTIRTVVRRSDAMALHLRRAAGPLILCHADLHPWNTLIDTSGYLWLVDWDEVILARQERDLMFIIGGIGSSTGGLQDAAHFLRGYGDAAIDRRALEYYRYAWAVQDMAAYAERVLFLPDLGEDSRREAVRGFCSMFQPGEIVSLALSTEAEQG